MSADDIFNALCAVWIQEDKRLSDKVKELEALIRYRTDNDALSSLVSLNLLVNLSIIITLIFVHCDDFIILPCGSIAFGTIWW